MTKSRPSLKNLIRAGLSLGLAAFILSGCSSSTEPTYPHEGIAKSVKDICKNEYSLDVKTTLVGKTLWVYFPVEDLLVEADKPEKYTERFRIEEDGDKVEYKDARIKLEYAISRVPEEERTQQVQYDKKILENLNNIWKAIRRVVFSMEHDERNEPNFFCIVTADIKNGFEMREMFYHLDMKKVSYEYISWGEYQHRAISETAKTPEIIGDKDGEHLEYKDISLKEFVALQIAHRIRLKFQKPEVGKNADIDREVRKIIATTLEIYGVKDFTEVELHNLITNYTTTLNQAAALSAE